MKENKLNKQISKIVLGIVGFFFLYLLVGFFLKSNYPINGFSFNTGDAFDVITNGLTLSAYFITPAIACVLFTDWRDQHRRINNEKVSNEIINLLSDILPFLNTPAVCLSDEEKYTNYQKKYFGNLVDLKSKIKTVNPNCEESDVFISKINEIAELLHDFWLKMQTQVIIKEELDRLKELGPDYDDMRKHYQESIQRADIKNSETLSKFIRIKQELKILYV